MTTDPSGLYIGRRAITALAVLPGLIALALIVPSHANANAGRGSSSLLREGVGMTARPSVRVQALQRALVRRGYSVGRHGADGRFGPRTRKAVRRFQAAWHLKVDGIVGPRSRAALHHSARTTTAKAHTRPAPHRPTGTNPSQPGSIVTAKPAVQTAPKGSSNPRRVAPIGVDSAPAWWRSPLLSGVLAALLAVAGAVALTSYRRRARAARYYGAHLARARMRAPQLPSADLDPSTLVSLPPNEPRAGRADAVSEAPSVVRGPAIGYVTGPAGLEADHASRSERAIERICARDGWTLLDIVRDTDGDTSPEGSGIGRALERIATGEARALVVSDSRLLGRGVGLAEVMARLDAAEAALIAIDLGMDTSTPRGRRIAGALITVSGWGRQRRTPRPAHSPQNGRCADRSTPRMHAEHETPPAGGPTDTGALIE